ncbi:MAG: ABC transporter ATP-binding protein/permease [Pseudomonadota bacterium]
MRRGRRPTTAGTPDIRTLARVLPDLWPREHPGLRVCVIGSLAFLILAKVAVLFTPFVYRDAVDALAPETETAILAVPIMLVVAYGATRLFGTVFQQLRDLIFARVGQHALRQLGLRVFRHVHQLSLGYHISRKTGALSRVIDRGIKAIDFLLRYLLFSIVPLLFELGVVAVIFLVEFGPSYLFVMLATIAAYVAFTFKVTEWRVKIRKEMNDQDQDAHQKAVDSLLNYETVKYFSAEDREAERYDRSMAAYQRAALKTSSSLAFLNSGQAFILAASMIAVMLMTAQGVVAGDLTVGAFVMVNAFMIQITMPLNFLGTVYREIRQSLVDMREMYELVDQGAEVEDSPGAVDLDCGDGAVRFDHAVFAYGPNRPILTDVSFEIPPGKTVAVVGPSGAGKSTIARLLFRFYDVSDGAVTIDGQDVRTVTQASLRRAIGVVPQDTVLFNDTIGYNIAYGRDETSHEEIEAAARSARIHDFISELPDGYETVVGERGLKLSGGEKQRVAIARTILKNPPILILDEATSALDTTTEREIQAELKRLGQGRTVLMIAHRLSTVVDADEIIVLDGGRVAERGSHSTLLALDGRYAALWHRQETEEPA